MLTSDDSLLWIWRSQSANKRITDDAITTAIGDAYTDIDARAMRTMTPGARDLAASYLVRINLGSTNERDLLRDIVNLLLGVAQ